MSMLTLWAMLEGRVCCTKKRQSECSAVWTVTQIAIVPWPHSYLAHCIPSASNRTCETKGVAGPGLAVEALMRLHGHQVVCP